jgi:hypothetical protein
MDGACRTEGRWEAHINLDHLEGRNHLGDLDVEGRRITINL